MTQRPRPEDWGIEAPLLPLLGGHRNVVWRTTGLERDYVFKSTRRVPAAVAWLQQVQDCARAAGVVVPQMIASPAGNWVQEGWTCETLIKGQNIAPRELPALRRQLMALHECTRDMGQRPGFLSSLALLEQSTGGDVDLQAMPKALVRRCRQAWAAVAGRPQAIVHGDLNCGNVLKTEEGRFALLDWDESRRDLVLFDLGQVQADDAAAQRARLAWEVACSWQIEPEHARALAQGL